MADILTVTLNPALDVAFEVEKLVAEKKLRTTPATFQPGGGGINVARVAHRLGENVTAMWLGGGTTASKMHALIDEEGVRQDHVPMAGEVRMSMNVEERATTDMYRFVLPGPTVSAAETEDIAAHIAASPAAFVVLSGSLPVGMATDIYARLAARAQSHANPPRVIVDASGEALDRALTKDVFLAKPNKNELGRLLGRDLATIDDVIAGARELVDARGVGALAVSLAEDGLVLVTHESAEHVRAPKVEMISAVGAGDSTVAGIVVGLGRGMSLRDATRLGVAAGTATVITPGTNLCQREDVERLFAQIA